MVAVEIRVRKERLVSIGFTVLFVVLSCFLMVPPAGAQTNTSSGNRPVIRAVIHYNYPPATFRDPKTQKAAGFAVEVMDEIAGRAGLSVVYSFEKDWMAIANVVRSGKADIAPGMGITEERQALLVFTVPIDTVSVSLFVRSDDYSILGLKPGLKVGVIKGSAAYEIIKKKYSAISFKIFDSFSDGLFDLLAGNLDAFCCPAPTLLRLARDAGVEDRIKIAGPPVMELKRGIALRKDDTKLFAKLNVLTQAFIEAPEYQRIYTKWHGKPKPFLAVSGEMLLSAIMIVMAIGVMAVWRYFSIAGLNRRLRQEISERARVEDTLREKNTMLQTLINAIPDQVFFKDAAGRYVLVNKTMEETLGIGQEVFVGKTDDDISPPDVAEKCKRSDRDAINKGEPVFSEEHYTNKDGEIRFLDVVKAPIFDDKGGYNGLVVVSRDITDRKRIDDALRVSEEKLRTLFESAVDALMLISLDGKLININRAAHERLGYTREEMMSMDLSQIDAPEFAEQLPERMERLRIHGLIECEGAHLRKDGSSLPVEINARLLDYEGEKVIFSVVRDISERKMAEVRILRSLREKEVLLKEIHHRVKNNMQVIYSLLNLQAKGITDTTVRAMFEESRDRVSSMALIHEKLYGSEDLSHIDFREYLRSLVGSIAGTYKRHDVQVSVDMDSLALDVNVGIPCGLIVNELVSNSLKYAFPGGRTGTISVGISKNGDGCHILTVADNGIGFPAETDFRNTRTLGMKLVNVLTGQIRGTIELSSREGTRFTITFPGKSNERENENG